MRSELSTVQHVGFVIPATGVSFDRLLSGVADAQLSLDAREYVAVWGCARALVAAVVAVGGSAFWWCRNSRGDLPESGGHPVGTVAVTAGELYRVLPDLLCHLPAAIRPALLAFTLGHSSRQDAFAASCHKPGPRRCGYVAVACSEPGGELGEAGEKR